MTRPQQELVERGFVEAMIELLDLRVNGQAVGNAPRCLTSRSSLPMAAASDAK